MTEQQNSARLDKVHLVISLAEQSLGVFDMRGNARDDTQGKCRCIYRISTALNGTGEKNGSGCTPRGQHCIRAKIGANAPSGSVFVGRRATGEIWTPKLEAQHPGRDWILTRILWLSGCEPGYNRLGNVDSMQRYIYIHGTPDNQPMGVARSHGCIRMRNCDVLALFDMTPIGTPVNIIENSLSNV